MFFKVELSTVSEIANNLLRADGSIENLFLDIFNTFFQNFISFLQLWLK